MGIINVTPDSFSDGGDYASTERAVARGFDLIEQGADLIDIGGESTRPGAQRVDARGELRRVVPVIRELASGRAVISVDTMRAEVARAAVEAGAAVVNDVSGGLGDPAMLPAVAELGVGYIAMHWRGQSDVMHNLAHYDDVVADVAVNSAIASTPRWMPASSPIRSCSTRASVSPRPPSTTGRCWPASTSWRALAGHC